MNAYWIRVGGGREVWRFSLAGINVRLHATPWSGGLTLYAPRDDRAVRTRRALMALAGPAVHGVLLLAVLFPGTNEVTFTGSGLHALPVFLLANAYLLLINLLPRRDATQDGVFESDGLVALKTPFLRGRDLAEHLVARFVIESAALGEAGRFEEACTRAREGLAAHPDSLTLRANLGLMLALAGRCDEARGAFHAALALDAVPAEMQAVLRNNVAWASLMRDDLDAADMESTLALEGLGWVPAILGTRGAVLVARGQVDEGLGLLRRALERSDQLHPMARATYEGATALGLGEKGDRAGAMAHLARARGAFAACPLLARVEGALERPSTAKGA
jgi:tetratricopeptide (TPR) repeat protein